MRNTVTHFEDRHLHSTKSFCGKMSIIKPEVYGSMANIQFVTCPYCKEAARLWLFEKDAWVEKDDWQGEIDINNPVEDPILG